MVLAGCGGRSGLPCVERAEAVVERKDEEEPPKPFDKLNVLVGVDGSESMIGFVSRPGSRYSQAIASLHTLLQNKNVPTSYWRIGGNQTINQAQPISSGQFLTATKPEFYCSRDQESPKYPCVSSTLGQIYELKTEATAGENTDTEVEENQEGQADTPPRTLKILLTDLEPDNSAVGTVSGLVGRELEENPDYKAVLIGVRSQFQGNVYAADGRSFPTFNYNTAGQDVDQKGRPFFILISGPQETVDELVKQFRLLPLDVNRAFRASSFELGEADTVTLDNTNFQQTIKKCVEPIGKVDGKRPSGDQELDWLMMEQENCENSKSNSLPKLTLEIPSKNTVALTGGELTPNLFNISESFVTVEKAEIVPNPSGEDSRLRLTTVFDGEKLGEGEGKLAYITLADRQLDQAVWQDWDMDVGQPDGAKTQNLQLFVSGLRGAIANEQDAVKFCVGYSRY
jgi:hypothetical protein